MGKAEVSLQTLKIIQKLIISNISAEKSLTLQSYYSFLIAFYSYSEKENLL